MSSIKIEAPVSKEFGEILTPDALTFVEKLERLYRERRCDLLAKRSARQKEIDAGKMPDFLTETAGIRGSDWKVSPFPGDLTDRRVEITGPSADTKMVINAFNSGANVYMTDFEDSQSPTWESTVQGQINLRNAVRRQIQFKSPEGKLYELNKKTATLMVRPRGWHLSEKHALLDGQPVSGSLFDFALFFFHNAAEQIQRGSGPYFYLPKMESHLEARLWNDVFVTAQEELKIPRGTIKATVLIETILAGFEMDEILHELKEHSAGLNCGRWDYIFSYIKKFSRNSKCVLPDRAQVTMDKGFLSAYVKLLIQTCHRRGAHAMGGMAAQIPIKSDPAANETALAKVRADKEREVKAGHDGTWVAHPGLVSVAKEIFDRHMAAPNQIAVKRDDARVTAADLLKAPDGSITEQGLRTNLNVGVLYLEAWLRGTGCVPLYNLMEDAATAEISRAQVWQWLRHNVSLSDGRKLTSELAEQVLQEELEKIRKLIGDAKYGAGKFSAAGKLFEKMMTSAEFPEFLTLEAYEQLP